MSFSKKISKIEGNYNQLSFPVLGVSNIKNNTTFLINEAFEEAFIQNQFINAPIEIIKIHFNKLENNHQIHDKGNIYLVDEFQIENGVKYYFYSLSKQSVQHSFLWLKHDLLNILNPIMGFADVLEESEEMAKEDLVLVQKIKKNSDRIYHQIQKLALIQNLETQNNQSIGTYEIEDFIHELQNQLTANHIIEHIKKTEISHRGKVCDRITQSDFRSTLEEHIAYLTEYQKNKDIKVISVFYNHVFRLKVQLINCKPPSTHTEIIEEVDAFIDYGQPINKLQISSLNYLILNEICDSFGASFRQKTEADDVILELKLPSLSKEDEVKTLHQKSSKSQISIIHHEFLDEMPNELLKQTKEICKNFDGLLILDEWQKMCNQLEDLNQKHQNNSLSKLIKEIKAGIQGFDVEKLRQIYQQCQLIWQK